jgi:potassium-dependent mechanosensitive channel
MELKDIYNFICKIFSHLLKAWDHPIFTMDGQTIAFSNILIAISFTFIGLRVSRHLSNLLHDKLLRIINLDITVTNLLGKMFHYLLIIIVVVFALDIAHLPFTAFTFIGGAFAVSLGVGGQHVVNNFISGIVLMIEAPIKVGDLIESGSTLGRVKSIDARSINLLTYENKNVFIPHSVILQHEFKNWTHDDNKVMITTKFKIYADEVNLEHVRNVIISAVLEYKDVIDIPSPQLLVLGFDYNALDLELNFYVNMTFIARKEILNEINSIIIETLVANKISLAKHPINQY